MATIHRPWFAMCFVCLMAPAGHRAQAATPDDAKHAPLAVQRLREVAAAYKALPAYSDHGVTTIIQKEGVATRTTEIPGNLSFARPSKFRLSYGTTPFELASDGKTILFVFPKGQDYLVDPAPAKVTFESVADTPAGRKLQAMEDGSLHVRVLFDLLMADDPVAVILGRAEALSLEEDREVAGEKHWSLLMDIGKGLELRRLFIDPDTKLLRRIEAVDRVGGPQNSPRQVVRWDAGAISTARLPDQTFDPRLKDGAHEIRIIKGTPEDLTAQAQGQARETEYRARFIGKPAPDFTLTVLDGEDSTRLVSKANLAGKVVLIDFWATWCGPCLEALPQLAEIARRYAEREDLVIIALSQDEKSTDQRELRKLVEKTLTRLRVDLAGSRNGLVALDPVKAVGEAFEVYGLPTAIILDRRGVIRAIQVGITPPDVTSPVKGTGVRVNLAKELDLLLNDAHPSVPERRSSGTP